MPYGIKATRQTPALIIYLIDVSGSMTDLLDGASKIAHVNQALRQVFERMIQRSLVGEQILSRYEVALFSYSDKVVDIFGGPRLLQQVVDIGIPEFTANEATSTYEAFAVARDLLVREMPRLAGRPAPLVCHLTDGEHSTADPEPMVREIMGISTSDGNVLVENVYLGADLTQTLIRDVKGWPGVGSLSELKDPHAQKLFRMSSPLPPSYAEVLATQGYRFAAGNRMLIPGTRPELVELGFVMSKATDQVRR